MFGIDAAIYVYCTYVFVENKNLKPETWNIWMCIMCYRGVTKVVVGGLKSS